MSFLYIFNKNLDQISKKYVGNLKYAGYCTIKYHESKEYHLFYVFLLKMSFYVGEQK